MSDVADRLDRIRERVEVATEGPWRARSTNPVNTECVIRTSDGALAVAYNEADSPWDGAANSEFIARSRSDVPYLLSLVEEVGEALAQMPDWKFIDWHQHLIKEHDNVDTALKLDDLRDAALQAEEQDDD